MTAIAEARRGRLAGRAARVATRPTQAICAATRSSPRTAEGFARYLDEHVAAPAADERTGRGAPDRAPSPACSRASRHVAVGALSPIPGRRGAARPRARRAGGMRVSMLGSAQHNYFTDGGRELFDCAAQGRIDAFFLGGGQIDGAANINLVGIGDYPQSEGPLRRLVRLGLPLLPRAARDPVPRGAHAADARRAGRFRQRARRQPARRLPAGRARRARDRAAACSASTATRPASGWPASTRARRVEDDPRRHRASTSTSAERVPETPGPTRRRSASCAARSAARSPRPTRSSPRGCSGMRADRRLATYDGEMRRRVLGADVLPALSAALMSTL